MRNLYIIVLAIFTLVSCDDDTNLPAPYYSIEGKWIWSPSQDRADANRMYELASLVRFNYGLDYEIIALTSELDEKIDQNEINLHKISLIDSLLSFVSKKP